MCSPSTRSTCTSPCNEPNTLKYTCLITMVDVSDWFSSQISLVQYYKIGPLQIIVHRQVNLFGSLLEMYWYLLIFYVLSPAAYHLHLALSNIGHNTAGKRVQVRNAVILPGNLSDAALMAMVNPGLVTLYESLNTASESRQT